MRLLKFIRGKVRLLAIIVSLAFSTLLVALGCGSETTVSTDVSTIETPDSAISESQTQTRLFTFEPEYSDSFSLFPLGLIGEVVFDKPSYDNHIVIWQSEDIPQAAGKYIAQTRSKDVDGVTLAECAIPEPGNYSLTANTYSPFDTQLLFPLGTQDVQITVDDPGCYTLEFEERPTVIETNDGIIEDFRVRVRIEDQQGNLFTVNGSRPPVEIRAVILAGEEFGTVTPTAGVTNSNGYFRGEATLNVNLGGVFILIEATYTDPETGFTVSGSAGFIMIDRCNSNDSEEREQCPPPPTLPPDVDPTPCPTPGCCYACNLLAGVIEDLPERIARGCC